MAPQRGEKPRVADVVPALEDAIALVIATPPAARPPPAPPEADALPESEKQRRIAQVVAEYRGLQRTLNQLGVNEMNLINQANMLAMMLRLEAGTVRAQREEELRRLRAQLDDVGTRKAQTVRRLNELAGEYRALQGGAAG